MSESESEIKFVICKASYWVGDATEYGCVFWLKEKGKWTEEFEEADFLESRSTALERLESEKNVAGNRNFSIVEIELHRD
ncbi:MULTISPECIES: DUF2849 domain-containing protein [unclassified Microcoleus]|uniref:DUF2849 domain-containing protein n=1 Tax=unclassified Microcoleus TaxID=2642155 RepID=UPI002FCE7422